jgi:CheY-like chemotaxis protein
VDATKPSSKAEAILLVDDDDLYVRATTRLLRGLGYPFVFRSPSATEALQMLERLRPSLVLTDMVMEHRSAGLEVIAACQSRAIRVAVISGMPGLEEASVGCRIARKASLSGSAVERLIEDVMAEPATVFQARPSGFVAQSLAMRAG